MRFLIKLFIFLTLLAAQARADFSVVKVVSKGPFQGNVFNGSGFAFQHQGKAFVLTSDHVVFHENQPFKHEVRALLGNPDKSYSAIYKIADWGYGLALLEVSESVNLSKLPKLDLLCATLPKAADSVVVTGVAALSASNTIVDSRGIVERISGADDFFVELSNVLQIKNAHGEFGMSGGPVFDQQGCLSGILSHQVLISQNLNEPRRPEDWSAVNSSPDNHLVGIAGDEALKWVKRYMTDPVNFKMNFFQDTEMQLRAQAEVYSGKLWFIFLDAFGVGKKNTLLFETTKNAMTTTVYEQSRGTMQKILGAVQFQDLPVNDRKTAMIYGFRGQAGDFSHFGTMIDFFRSIPQNPDLIGIFKMKFETESHLKKELEALIQETEKLTSSSDTHYNLYRWANGVRVDIDVSNGFGTYENPFKKYAWAHTTVDEMDRILAEPSYWIPKNSAVASKLAKVRSNIERVREIFKILSF